MDISPYRNTNKRKKDGEVYIPHLKFYVSGFPTSPFGIEWMRFEVKDIEKEIKEKGLTVLTPINSPAEGIFVTMIELNGAPIELIQFNIRAE